MPVKVWGGYEVDLRSGAINWADTEYDARLMGTIYRQELISAFEALQRWPHPVVTEEVIVQASDAGFEIIRQS